MGAWRVAAVVSWGALMASTSALALDFERTADGVIVTPASGPAKKVRLQVMSDRAIRVTASPTCTTGNEPNRCCTFVRCRRVSSGRR